MAEKDPTIVTSASEQTAQPQAAPGRSRPKSGLNTQNETSSYEEYLYGGGTYAKGKEGLAWSDSTKGRMAIRLVSRGLFGAAGFAWGQRVIAKQMTGYHPETWVFDESKPLQVIAKGFDTMFGKPIQAFARRIAPEGQANLWAKESVNFRSKGYYFGNVLGHEQGRSLGAEMVGITFDFASMSVGDATARNIIQLFDPNLQKPWIGEDGKFDDDKLLDYVGKTAWRIISKNQGEDWVAALPYVYQMKWQRQALSKVWDGFKLSSDRQWNGGSFRVNNRGQIVGDYQAAGAIDLHARFVGYNWYTLMYNESYDAVARGFKQWQENGYKIDATPLLDNPITAIGDAIGASARYAAKSFIKANLYMNIAVIPFWLFRTPQTKWRASPIMSDYSEAPTTLDKEGKNIEKIGNGYAGRRPYESQEWRDRFLKENTNLEIEESIVKKGRRNVKEYHVNGIDFRWDTARDWDRLFQGGTHTWDHHDQTKFMYFGDYKIKRPNLGGDKPFAWENQKTGWGKLLNPFGWVSYKYGSGLVHLGDHLAAQSGTLAKVAKFIGDTPFRREMNLRTFSDASIAYTPYFIAKQEYKLRFDDTRPDGQLGEMDKAIYQAMDSLVSFDARNLKVAFGKIGGLMFGPHEDLRYREGDAKAIAEIKEEAKEVVSEANTANKPDARVSQIKIETSKPLGIPASQPQLKPFQEILIPKPSDGRHTARLAEKTRQAQTSMLYPEHRTLQ
jgi:hypothetical protein